MVEIKGTTLAIGRKVFLSIHGEKEFQRVLSRLSKEERDIYNGPIWPSEWYPMEYTTHLGDAILAEIYHGDEQANLEQMHYPAIEEQFNLVYKAYLLLNSPELVLQRLVRITEAYFRGITVDIQKLDRGRTLLTYRGFKTEHRIVELSIRSWWEKVLESTRAKNPAFTIQTSLAEDKGYGEYLITWDAK